MSRPRGVCLIHDTGFRALPLRCVLTWHGGQRRVGAQADVMGPTGHSTPSKVCMRGARRSSTVRGACQGQSAVACTSRARPAQDALERSKRAPTPDWHSPTPACRARDPAVSRCRRAVLDGWRFMRVRGNDAHETSFARESAVVSMNPFTFNHRCRLPVWPFHT